MFRTMMVIIFLFVSVQAFANVQFYAEERQKQYRGQPQQAPAFSEMQDLYNQEAEIAREQLEVISTDQDKNYIIVAGDTVIVAFMDRGEIRQAVYKVSTQGQIELPLINKVKISGLNRLQAREMIQTLFEEYIRRPEVRIAVNSVGKYMVLGAGGPGTYNLSPNLRLMEAILRSGFDRDRTNLKSVIVMRGTVENPVILRKDLHKMVKKGDREDNILVKPGDLIYLPTSFIWHIERFKDNMFKLLIDYYILGGDAILDGNTDDSGS